MYKIMLGTKIDALGNKKNVRMSKPKGWVFEKMSKISKSPGK